MWNKQWREDTWNNLDQPWDMLIIGGGITGAGVLRAAVHAGLKALLVEANDFSFGTSSRSSKLIHGGFRYLGNRQIDVTRESVREREWMIREAPHLVYKQGFHIPYYASYRISLRVFRLGVLLYDLLAPKWAHRSLSTSRMRQEVPGINPEGLLGGFLYYDACMDDSRIVLRVLREACLSGGTVLNYALATKLLRKADGKVCGVVLADTSGSSRTAEVQAKVVVNATGPWTDELRSQLGETPRLRKLRGSHLVFTRERFPFVTCIGLVHPRDQRALFIIPFEGTTMIGTTNPDHPAEWEQKYAEPFASVEEIDYLLEAANFIYPDLKLEHKDIISTFAGLRPTIRVDGEEDPSKVSRAHELWDENGLLTITGGKYTTFRIMARQTVQAVLARLGKDPVVPRKRFLDRLPDLSHPALDTSTLAYLLGRYGAETAAMLSAAQPADLEPIPPLQNSWAELRWAAREEGTLHLTDLLLRRVRLGLLLPDGAAAVMDRVRAVVQPEMGWSDTAWSRELTDYQRTWASYYGPKPGSER
jgi:glycerol-3-phosphate dehydrogenase